MHSSASFLLSSARFLLNCSVSCCSAAIPIVFSQLSFPCNPSILSISNPSGMLCILVFSLLTHGFADGVSLPARRQVHSTKIHRSRLQNTGIGGQCSAGSVQDVAYHGGTLMTQQVELYNIYIGQRANDYSSSTTPSILGTFAENLSGSRYGNIITYYHDNTKKHPKLIDNSYSFQGNIYYTYSGHSLDDSVISSAIQTAISTNAITPNSNQIYSVFFRGDYHYYSAQRNASWLTDWCGIHGTVTLSGVELVVLAIDDSAYLPLSSPNKTICAPLFYGAAVSSGASYTGAAPTCHVHNCSFSSPNGNAAADAMVSVYTSMLFEARTDKLLDGYYRDCDGAEVGDLCHNNYGEIQTSGSVNFNVEVGSKKYLVQQQWIFQPNHSDSVCVLGADAYSGASMEFTHSLASIVLIITFGFTLVLLL